MPIPNQLVSTLFYDCWLLYFVVWHLDAWYLDCDRNLKPLSELIYLQQFEQIEPYFHICHVGDKGSEINVVQMIEYLFYIFHTNDIDLDAGSLTTYFNYIIPGCPLRAFNIFIYRFILLFLTGFNTFTTTFLSSKTAIPIYTSEYFPFPILVMI